MKFKEVTYSQIFLYVFRTSKKKKSGYSHSYHQYQHTDLKRESVSCPRMFINFVWKSTLMVCASVTCI